MMNAAWRLHSYNGLKALKLETNLPLPIIRNPYDVLIKVSASSVNPLDLAMTEGYGRNVLNLLRCKDREFPLTLGRDFSGIVYGTGKSVTKFRRGDNVWGAIFPSMSGSFSKYITLPECYIGIKPKNLTHSEASSIPYAALTASSALKLTANIQSGMDVLILGGSGGVGTNAIQLLRNWGVNSITATVSETNINLVKSLGVDEAWDYTQQFPTDKKFDVILDCSGQRKENKNIYLAMLKSKNCNSCYVSLDSPVLSETDSKGIIGGGFESLFQLWKNNVNEKQNFGKFKWGYFAPDITSLNNIKDFIELNKFKPVIDSTFKFSQLDNALSNYKNQKIKGKIVINYENEIK